MKISLIFLSIFLLSNLTGCITFSQAPSAASASVSPSGQVQNKKPLRLGSSRKFMKHHPASRRTHRRAQHLSE